MGKHYFQPIVVDNECVIHSTFHTDIPDVRYKIVIDPKMAFGTGHHETTSLMLEWILRHDFEGEHVLDMGCGTAILAILARMRNAKHVTAIDIDEWAYENAKENIRLNETDRIEVLLGDKQLLHTGLSFDTVLANINRNIHLDNMQAYASVMHQGSTIYMSGFYTQDLPILQECAAQYGLHYKKHLEKTTGSPPDLRKNKYKGICKNRCLFIVTKIGDMPRLSQEEPVPYRVCASPVHQCSSLPNSPAKQ